MKKLSLILLAILTVALIGCKKDDDSSTIKLKEGSKTLHHNGTYQIEAESENVITYTSENNYIAEVTNYGFVYANYVGATNIVLNDGESTEKFKVTVAAESNLYTLPNIKFGETRSTIISRFGNPVYEDEDGAAFEKETTTTIGFLVMFDDTNKVIAYSMIVKPGYGNELVNVFIPERYVYLGESNNYQFYMDAFDVNEADVLVGLAQESGYWMAMYADRDYFPYAKNPKLDAMQNLVKKLVK